MKKATLLVGQWSEECFHRVGFPTEDAENCALEYSFEHAAGGSAAQSQERDLSNCTKVDQLLSLHKAWGGGELGVRNVDSA
jgi:hypothetical protein